MSANFGAAHIDLSSVDFTPQLLRCLPAEMARKFRVLPITESAAVIGIAMAEPSDLNAVDTLAHHFNRPVYIYVAEGGEVDACIERLYGRS
ncbi:MAG TPA: hypothetical protein VNV43_03400 [Candidatus Acidoferrales bacterium]|jgi:type IV pilus assembly protein PilB|nr:hypothetical protein [Candidatus Acidoferrales bacterium]